MRQSLRVTQESPKDSYSNFTRGMEYNAHAKETSNSRVQLIKNMEVQSDGKLTVRRPLIPHKLNKKTFDTMYNKGVGVEVLKVIHAPFAKLDIPFLWMTKNADGEIVLSYYRNNSHDQADVVDSEGVLSTVGADSDYIFKDSLNFLIVSGSTGIIIVEDGSMNANEISLKIRAQTDYLPTNSEIVSEGLNLYLDNPFFLSNTVDGSTFARVVSIDTYKIPASQNVVDSSKFTYDPAPLETDHLMLKARISAAHSAIVNELSYFYFSDGHPKWNFNKNYEDSKHMHTYVPDGSGGYIENTDVIFDSGELWEDLIYKVSPKWEWRRQTVDEATELDKASEINPGIAMPLFVSFIGDSAGEAAIEEIGKQVFSDTNWHFDTDLWVNVEQFASRRDLLGLPAGFSDNYRYSVTLDWDESAWAKFEIKNLDSSILAPSTGANLEDKGIVFGDSSFKTWAGDYKNESTHNQLNDMSGSIVIDGLDPSTDYGLILSDFYAPRGPQKDDKEVDGLHKIKINFSSPQLIRSIKLFTPIPEDTTVTMRDMTVTNFIHSSKPETVSLGGASGSHAVFKGGQ